MEKITVTLDAKKLRGLVSERTYKNKEGQGVTVQEVKFDLIGVKEPKAVYSSDKFDLVKTHFAAEIQTKEQRDAQADTNFIGEGLTIQWKQDSNQPKPSEPTPNGKYEQPSSGDDSDLPF